MSISLENCIIAWPTFGYELFHAFENKIRLNIFGQIRFLKKDSK